MRHSVPFSRFVELSADLLARGYSVRFRAAGQSMRPSIGDGDILTIAPRPASGLRTGAVAVYQRDGRIFAHRLVGSGFDAGGRPVLIFRGDAARISEAPVPFDHVFGEVIDVERAPRLAAVLVRVRRTVVDPMRRLRDLCGTFAGPPCHE